MKSKIIAIRIEVEEFKKVEILRKKHCICTSELFRKTINDTYEKMEKTHATKH